MKRYGTSYGGYVYRTPIDLDSSSILYSFGAGEDISHDILLSHETGAPIHIFDPTPRSFEHVAHVKAVFEDREKPVYSKRLGGGDPNYWPLLLSHKIPSSQIVYHNYGIYTHCDTKPFYLPTNEEYVSCSLNPTGRSTKAPLLVDVKDLTTICQELDHPYGPDLLKLDIETVECPVLTHMVHETKYRPKWIAVDFDTARTGPQGINEVQQTIALLLREGYSILDNRSWDITFEYTL